MNDPIREKICEDLVTTLSRMKTGAGYFFDWPSIDRGENVEPDEYPAAAVLDGAEEIKQLAHPLHDCLLDVQIRGRGKSSESPSAYGNRMIADACRAVMQDIRRGGLAVNTMVTGTDKLPGWPATDDVLIDVFLQVHYRTSLTDPSDAR